MPKLHVVPGCSAAGSLRHAMESVRRDDIIAFHPDDLSCGPIKPGSPSERAAWWGWHPEDGDIAGALQQFWDRVTAVDEKLVVWFGRHASRELAFYLSLADQLGDRPYDIIDVTGVQYYWVTHDGSRSLRDPAQSMSGMHHDGLVPLLDCHRPITKKERDYAAGEWQRLKSENAPFRVLTSTGLVSAPIDHFDPLILDRVSIEPRRVIQVVADASGFNCDPYVQVGDEMLLRRLVSLVEAGEVIADGDPWDMRGCRVWLPALGGIQDRNPRA